MSINAFIVAAHATHTWFTAMEFLGPHHSYLKRLSISFLHSYLNTELRQASSLPTVYVSTGEEAADALRLHREKLEAELEELTTQTLARSKRRSKYKAVTVPSSVKHQVTESAPAMARPRSPQRKNDADLQGMLDEQLAAIRRQLVSLARANAKARFSSLQLRRLVHRSASPACAYCEAPGRLFIRPASIPGLLQHATLKSLP